MHGIETVYQDLGLALDLDIAGNLYLGRELVYRFLPRAIEPDEMARDGTWSARSIEGLLN